MVYVGMTLLHWICGNCGNVECLWENIEIWDSALEMWEWLHKITRLLRRCTCEHTGVGEVGKSARLR